MNSDDIDIKKLVRPLIEEEVAEVFADAIKAGLKPVYTMVEQIQTSQNNLVDQVNSDSRDLGNLKIDMGKIQLQNKAIISNQHNQTNDLIGAVKDETKKIPGAVEKAVNNSVGKKKKLYISSKSFIDKLKFWK